MGSRINTYGHWRPARAAIMRMVQLLPKKCNQDQILNSRKINTYLHGAHSRARYFVVKAESA